MDAKREFENKEKLAISVQKVLKNHHVVPENIGDTADFLAHVIGGMILTIFPENKRSEAIEAIKKEIEYGIEMGIPE